MGGMVIVYGIPAEEGGFVALFSRPCGIWAENADGIFLPGPGHEKIPTEWWGWDQREKSSLSYLLKSRALAFLGMRLKGS